MRFLLLLIQEIAVRQHGHPAWAANSIRVLVETVDEADGSPGDCLPAMIAKQSSARKAAKDPDYERTNDIGLHRIPPTKETGAIIAFF